jgi:putative membrane protein
MRGSRRFHVVLFVAALAGAWLFIGLLVRHGVRQVGDAVAMAGWGVGAVVAFHSIILFIDALAWWVLFPRQHRPRLSDTMRMRWIGESVGNLVPSSQVGGDIVRARLAAISRTPPAIAAATVVVDVTLSLFVQLVVTVSGVALLVYLTHRVGIVRPAILGTLIAVAAVGGFLATQRAGIFRWIGVIASKAARSESWRTFVQGAEALDAAVRELYARTPALVGSAGGTLLSWVAGAVEIWMAMYAMRGAAGASFAQACVLETVSQGARAALFLVPGGLGVQEGGYLVVGEMLGVPAETALALAMIRRVRELAVGVPGLVAWQWAEGRRLWREPDVGRARSTS